MAKPLFLIMQESSTELSEITRKNSEISPNAKRSGQRGEATFSYKIPYIDSIAYFCYTYIVKV